MKKINTVDLFTNLLKMFTEYLLCARHCFRHGDTAVNKTDSNPCFHRVK